MKQINSIINTWKVKHLRKVISLEEYNLERADAMNNQIHYWKVSKRRAKTTIARDCCNSMVNMYMKRYQYYINK